MKTDQEAALVAVRKEFGRAGFTSDHINYRRVGYRVGAKTVFSVGDTWEESIELLRKKVA